MQAGRRVGLAICRRLGRVCFVELEHQRIEPAVVHHGAIERGMATHDQRSGALHPGRIDVVGQRLAFEVEDVRQPGVGLQEYRLHEHAAEVAVEHHHVARRERLRRFQEQVVELGELGIGEVARDLRGARNLLHGEPSVLGVNRRLSYAGLPPGAGTLKLPITR